VAEPEEVAKVGLKQYIIEIILHFQKYSEYNVFRSFFNLCFLNSNYFLRNSVEYVPLKNTITAL